MPFGNHPLFRWTLGWAMPPKISFLKLTQTRVLKELYNKYHVLQDLIVPIKHVKNALSFFENSVKVSTVFYTTTIISTVVGMSYYMDTVYTTKLNTF